MHEKCENKHLKNIAGLFKKNERKTGINIFFIYLNVQVK